MANLRPLTAHVMPSYTEKNGDRDGTVDSVTSFHPMYRKVTGIHVVCKLTSYVDLHSIPRPSTT